MIRLHYASHRHAFSVGSGKKVKRKEPRGNPQTSCLLSKRDRFIGFKEALNRREE